MLLVMDVLHPSLCRLHGVQWTVQDKAGSLDQSVSFLLSLSVTPPPQDTMAEHSAQASTASGEDPVDLKGPLSS